MTLINATTSRKAKSKVASRMQLTPWKCHDLFSTYFVCANFNFKENWLAVKESTGLIKDGL